MNNQLDEDEMTPNETRLIQALDSEAHQMQPDDDALRLIRTRTSATERDTLASRRIRRQRVLAGALVVGLAAATAIVVQISGVRPDTAPNPEPARTPSLAVPDDRFDPSYPRTSWTVYRVGDDPDRSGYQPMLFAEDVRATAPYQPREALRELLTSAPADPDLGDGRNSRRDQVGDVVLRPDRIVVDLTTLDPGRGRTTAETAAAWVQALVVTAQEAFGTDKPVLFTLQGEPLSDLNGVDTRRPVSRGSLRLGYSHAIFLPRTGDQVTSPVHLSADPPAGASRWQVVSLESGTTVFDENLEDRTHSGAIGFSTDDLAPGAYRFTVQRDLADEPKGTPGWVRSVEFRVTSGGPKPATPPVTDPTTSAVPVTRVFLPAARGQGLIEEWRPRTTALAAVQAVLDGSSADPRLDRPALPGARLTTVTDDGDQVTVDFAGLGEAAHSGAQALTHTLDAYYGVSRPVQLTVRGRPPALAGWPGRLTSEPVDVSPQTGLFTPVTDSAVDNPLTIVGRAEASNSAVTWYLIDPVSNETRFQGTATVDPTNQVYAFSLPVPPGDYFLQTVQKIGKDRTRVNYGVSVG